MDILIVDDETMVRSSMANMVAGLAAGHRVDEAEDGEEAVALLQSGKYDLVITDIRMPVMNGIQLSTFISEHNPGTYIVILTGYADFSYAQTAIRLNVHEYLLKPVSTTSLKEVIENIDGAIAQRRSRQEISRLREEHLLEKRVQDLFYEIPVPYCDETLFPPYAHIAVICFALDAAELPDNTIRFAAKNIIGEVLADYGKPVVVIEESHISSVLFVQAEEPPKPEQITEKVAAALKRFQHICVRAEVGGVGNSIVDIYGWVQDGLQKLGIARKPPAPMTEKPTEPVHRLIRQAQAMIHEQYGHELTLTSLAEKLYVNPNYLSSLFKSETGVTFSQYLTQIRVEKAKQLLRETNLKIYQICDHIGYADQAHFSRVFKVLEGMNPYDYREQSKLS